ncbi:pullulanase-type alpha-1,6-glucosidase [uncultured Photobacterium sp.]|uniref:pullulanase-type alpha-1,6-glucosidase n=1 Tax=uncultured Photobacterium sp. TaxID=173973 RepID=UPI002639CDD4|nr:pullulanase-type alpha-1,6-glucosidase [uncultured Photobacterium sp.]
MSNKLSSLALSTMPRICTMALVTSFLLVGCNSSDSDSVKVEPTPIPNQGTYPNDMEVVIYAMDPVSSVVAKAADNGEKTLHIWNNGECSALDGGKITGFRTKQADLDWAKGGLPATGHDGIGYYWMLPLKSQAESDCVNFIIRTSDGSQSPSLKIDFSTIKDRQAFVPVDYTSILDNPNDLVPVTLKGASAHWIDEDTLVWGEAKQATSVELYYSQTANIKFDDETQKLSGGTAIKLSDGTVSKTTGEKFPLLKGWTAFDISGDTDFKRDILKGQLIAVARDAAGKPMMITKVQIPGVLDALYTGGKASEEDRNADLETLGAVVDEAGNVTFAVWAPTAQSVELLVYKDISDIDNPVMAEGYPQQMLDQDGDGVYKVSPKDVVSGSYYRYRVKVYHPVSDDIELFETTDPYGQSFSTNSHFSQVVNMNDPELVPDGWNDYKFDPDAKSTDASLYEVHIRDFSVNDTYGTPKYNGKYMAFTEEERESVKHLKSMVESGLSYIHLTPTFDIGTVNEDPAKRIDLNNKVGDLCKLNATAGVCKSVDHNQTLKSLLESFDPKSDSAQALMNDIRDFDSFNWGYDPYHYNAPEGSTSTDAEGTTRIREFREMVQALHNMGLKVVMDMVYNHTNASGLAEQSVLDKLVPGYYHRLNEVSGVVERSTCCDNTATEHTMMEKVMIDSLAMWTRDYKIDSYRFDLAGFHMKSNMLKARDKVHEQNPTSYFYMEAWDYGETEKNRLGVNGSQWNMAGTHYGTFSDRLRDSVRGTVYSDSGETMTTRKGFANAGPVYNDAKEVKELNRLTDLVRLGMAANLKNYLLVDQNGETKRGQDIKYGDQRAGYADNPEETVNYISKHDNQTLWDINQYKIDKKASLDERIRTQNVANSTVLLAQGVPFFQLGVSLLRSKSMQRDSYNSGDWFNKVDFDLDNQDLTNNWNVGLPRWDKDGTNYPYIKLAIDNVQKPHREDLLFADQQFKELLKVRTTSKLFRLDTADQINQRVDFHNTGKEQVPGVIVMSIDDGIGLEDLDPNYDAVVAVLNATVNSQTMTVAGASDFKLHEMQANGVDDVVQGSSFAEEKFTVPALTTAVFVKKQAGLQGNGLPVGKKDTSNLPTFGDTELYLKGINNDWGDTNAMTFANGVYSLQMALGKGDQVFKVADAKWSDETDFGMEKIELGTGSLPLVENSGNIGFTAAVKGLYRFTLDASVDAKKPTVSVVLVKEIDITKCSKLADSSEAAPLGATKLFMKGSHSGWEAQDAYQLKYKGNNVYQAYFSLNTAIKGIGFKIADEDWKTQYTVTDADKLNESIEYPVVQGDGSNNTIDLTAATYSVKLTFSAKDNKQGMLKFEQCQ